MVAVQDGVTGEQDEEAERESSLLQIELETMKAVEQMQMLQQVSMCSRTPPDCAQCLPGDAMCLNLSASARHI